MRQLSRRAGEMRVENAGNGDYLQQETIFGTSSLWYIMMMLHFRRTVVVYLLP